MTSASLLEAEPEARTLSRETEAGDRTYRVRRSLEAVLVPAGALLIPPAALSLFLLCLGKQPGDFFALVWRGAFGTSFSLENTLQRAAPLLLTALCVALPAQLGLVV